MAERGDASKVHSYWSDFYSDKSSGQKDKDNVDLYKTMFQEMSTIDPMAFYLGKALLFDRG